MRVWKQAYRKEHSFGFNGMEMDSEISGQGNSYTTLFRQNDPRIGRWLSTDPVFQPHQSPYTSMDNNPITLIDPLGNQADGYIDEDGNYLGDDGDTESHETRVINKDKWDEIAGGLQEGEFTDAIRTQLRTTDNVSSSGDLDLNSKLLKEYEKGISISDDVWKKLEAAGGQKLNPYVQNLSPATVYYKGENLVDGKDLNPYTNYNQAYPIAPNTDLYAPVDGVSTGKYSNAVYKVLTGTKLKVLSSGEISAVRGAKPDGWFEEGSNFSKWFLDSAWDKLFESAKLNGGVKCDGCQ